MVTPGARKGKECDGRGVSKAFVGHWTILLPDLGGTCVVIVTKYCVYL